MKLIKKPSIKFIAYENKKTKYIARYCWGDVLRGEFRDFRLPKKIWERI